MSDLALYVGEAGNVGLLHPGGELVELVPHETVAEVGYDEANASDYWQPVGNATKSTARRTRSKRPKRSKTAPSESAGVDEGAGAPSEDAETGA